MSRSKKKKYSDMFASCKDNDKFGTLFDSMCKNSSYQSLSIGARQFYTLCRVQSKSSHGMSCLYQHGAEDGEKYNDNDFVFPAKHLDMYGVDRSNACRYINELEAAGFIDRKEKNKHRKKVNVYAFSNRWKDSS